MNDSDRYRQMLVGPIKRFHQANDMFHRAVNDPKVIPWMERFRDRERKMGAPGFTQADYSLADSSWYIEDHFAMGNLGANHDGLYAWEGRDDTVEHSPRLNLEVDEATRMVKKTARYFGAALVGVCHLNPLWLYSHNVNDLTGEVTEIVIPEGFHNVIVMGVEMDYDLMKTSPAGGAAGATGIGYSKMAFLAGMLAQFIRGLGYGALPCGNDTALSIPLAVEAGLGELGRNGLLVTEKYGPRVRLCKVFTNLSLEADTPHFFGVEAFCTVCKKCAQTCPPQAIPYGEKTSEAFTISNNGGVEKWMINPEQCFRFWGSNRMDCANCIRTCPFNQKRGWHHDIARFFIKHLPWLNPWFLWLHGLLMYEEQADPAGIWD